MPTNSYLFLVAAFIPMFVGFIYYHDMVLGKPWKTVNGFTDEYLGKANMAMVMGSAYVFCCFLALLLSGMVIHQGHVAQMMVPEVSESGSAIQSQFNGLMQEFGGRYRSFGHGALHGAITGLLFVTPLIGVNAMFERRGWKYILIHGGYWVITLTLMGGFLCSMLKYAPLS